MPLRQFEWVLIGTPTLVVTFVLFCFFYDLDLEDADLLHLRLLVDEGTSDASHTSSDL